MIAAPVNPRPVLIVIGVKRNQGFMAFASNDDHQQWEPAAKDSGILTEVNGWLPYTAWCGYGTFVNVSRNVSTPNL